MSEVEKMYELAMVTPTEITVRGIDEEIIHYPPFIAEKQLELIKFLSNFWVHINKVNKQFNISTGGGYVSYYAEDLADAIALYINSKWNNLTEQERAEIAEILK